MIKRAVIILLVLVFASVSMTRVQFVNASPSTITINADGTVTPLMAPISNVGNVMYTLTSDISDSILVMRDNIILEGGGHRIQGVGNPFSKGVDLWYGRKNVTVQNMEIVSFGYGVSMESSAMENRVFGCSITNNSWTGVYISSSSTINITGNTFAHNAAGITLSSSSNNHILANSFTGDGLYVLDSSGNVVQDNTVNGKPLVYHENLSAAISLADAGQVILINCSNIWVRDLNLSDTTVGVELVGTRNVNIVNNTLENNAKGIWFYNSSDNNVLRNTLTNNSAAGINLELSSHNTITNNTVVGAAEGIRLESLSNNNVIAGNNIAQNMQYGISVIGSSDNLIYHNNFIDNAQQAYSASSAYINSWDDGNPSGGNFWSDYGGIDTDEDGLGETSYSIDAGNVDAQPLMGVFQVFNMGSWNSVVYEVEIISKSTLTNFSFNPDNHTISFQISGLTGTGGFCRVTIPKGFMWVSDQSEWSVRVDGTPFQRNIIDSMDDTYIYFSYTHSTKTVQIQSTAGVPEHLPSIALIILSIAAALLLILKKRKHD